MTLSERLTEDMKAAMRRGDRFTLDTLRTLKARLIELSKRGEEKPLTPDDEVAAVAGAIKKRQEAIELYEKGGRADLAGQERKEIEILSVYLPQQMTTAEAEEHVRRAIQESGSSSLKDIGRVMGLLMKDLKGKIDGKVLQEIVRKQLGG
jgi:hypothetical protein